MKMKQNKKGFTLIELLVVVLIIGILAAIALPQYEVAVTKSKVAAILPIMRHIKDSYMEWKLTNGSYCDDEKCASLSDIGVECPGGWSCFDFDMYSDYWRCTINDEANGVVYCFHDFDDSSMYINMFQPDDEEYPEYAGMLTCEANKSKALKICKALGGKQINEHVYQL